MSIVFTAFFSFFSIFAHADSTVVSFKTKDGVRIVADYSPAEVGEPVFVLLHGMGAGRGEWRVFRATLAARGYGSLALDARGHGDSGGKSYRTFRTPAAWGMIEGDLEAAVKFLKLRGVAPERIVFAGASIGANICLRAALRHEAAPFVVLLSPGLAYQGLFIEMDVRKFKRPIIAAAAPGDSYAYKTLTRMGAWVRNNKGALLAARNGHGVGMLEGKGNRRFVRELMRRIDALADAMVSSDAPVEKRASP